MIPRSVKHSGLQSPENITSETTHHLVDSLIASSETSWQQELSRCSISLAELLRYLHLPANTLDNDYAALTGFSLKVPPAYLAKIEKGNLHDPLLKQILPSAEEINYQPGFTQDPLEENSTNPTPGLIHKYHGRVLLIVTQSCAIHCRYCFRRHFNYSDNRLVKKDLEQALTYLKERKDINEVILSGGDPLAINNRHFAWLLEQLNGIEHIKRLRIHSRLAVVLPKRIDDELLQILAAWRGQKVMVIHANHANELGEDVANVIRDLQQINVTTLNQAVLLKGVNDSAQTLIELSEALFNMGVLPYYLHQLDKVQGAAHFLVSDSEAKRLLQAMSHQLPGFLVPRLVREEAGKKAKTPLPIPI